MMACEGSDQAVVKYTFGGNNEDVRTFRTTTPPIIVDTSQYELGIPGGQCNYQYIATVFFGHECGGTALTGTTDILIHGKALGAAMETYFPPYDGPNQGSGPTANLRVYYQGGSRGGRNDLIFVCSGGIGTNRANYYARIVKVVPQDPTKVDNCGDLRKCSILIKNPATNQIIFKDQGDCPCDYEIQCDGCPPGHIKGDSSGYPGYCCLPCSEIKSGLQVIAQHIRSLRNG